MAGRTYPESRIHWKPADRLGPGVLVRMMKKLALACSPCGWGRRRDWRSKRRCRRPRAENCEGARTVFDQAISA